VSWTRWVFTEISEDTDIRVAFTCEVRGDRGLANCKIYILPFLSAVEDYSFGAGFSELISDIPMNAEPEGACRALKLNELDELSWNDH
jgi:hypothetical protein